MRAIFTILFVLVVGGLVGASIVYHDEISAYSDQYLLQRKASQWLSQGNETEAIHTYQEGVKKYPKHVELNKALAEMYRKRKEWDAAAPIYHKLTLLAPQDLDVRIGYGAVLFHQNHFNKAIIQFRKALELDPYNTATLNNLGRVFLKAAQNPKETRKKVRDVLNKWAIYYYLLSLQQDPDQLDPHFSLGVLYQRLRKEDKAAVQYCRALLLDKSRFELRYNLGLSLIALNEYEEGFRQLDEAVHLLANNDEVEAAQQLAETVQGIKNAVLLENQDERKASLHHTPHLPPGFDYACLLTMKPVKVNIEGQGEVEKLVPVTEAPDEQGPGAAHE